MNGMALKWAPSVGSLSSNDVLQAGCSGQVSRSEAAGWRRAIAKCVLGECGDDAKAACGSTQLCAGLEVGIEGAIHAVTAHAKEHETLDFCATEVNDDIWLATCEEGKSQDATPVRIL